MNEAVRAVAPEGEMILVEHLPFETDGGIASRASIGLIVLATDFTIEHEWRQIMTNLRGVALYQSRILNDTQITPETLRAMDPLIADAANLILPGSELDVVAFGCTSAAMAIGEEKVFERIRTVRPKAKCTTPITGAFAAFRALGARRIGVLTPYRADVNHIVASYIRRAGFEVPVFGSFNEQNDGIVAKISPQSILNGILAIRERAAIDAVFVSCTSVRLAEAAAGIERQIGLPVTSSNHAMAWHALRLAGIDDKLPQWGRLFTV
jgi:maleate isomerase